MASLLSSPCVWAAHKTGAAADAKPAAQTETVKPAKAEKTAAATEMAAETAAEPLPADSYSAAKVVSGEKTALADSYAALVADESALLVKNGAEVTLSHGAITKSGATTDVLGSKFHGQNAAVLAADGALSMDGCTIRTEADGANAVFATGARAA